MHLLYTMQNNKEPERILVQLIKYILLTFALPFILNNKKA